MSFSLTYRRERMTPTDLHSCYQIWHTLEIVGCEIDIPSRHDFLQSLVYLCTEFLLTVPVPGQLPKSKGQLESS